MMNDLLLKLMKLRSKLAHDGCITIISINNKDLVIRVDWYLGGRYCYEQRFTVSELEGSNIDLADCFIEKANQEIERIVTELT